MADTDLEVEACGEGLDHEAHVWRPDGKRITKAARRDALRWCAGVETVAPPASMVEAVARFVDALDDPDPALVHLARTLAADLDHRDEVERPNVAGIAKELRATLAELRAAHDRHDDPAVDLAASMSTPVRH